ncbi:hypothetical protein TNCV_1610891, partial [Trichonephila clavipes]
YFGLNFRILIREGGTSRSGTGTDCRPELLAADGSSPTLPRCPLAHYPMIRDLVASKTRYRNPCCGGQTRNVRKYLQATGWQRSL